MRVLALAGPLVAAMALPIGSGASPRAVHDTCRGVPDTIALYGDVDGDGRPDAVYVVPDGARLSIDLSKNLVVQFFVSRAMIATPLLAANARICPGLQWFSFSPRKNSK